MLKFRMPNGTFKLPKVICSCGKEETVFCSMALQCGNCFEMLPENSFKISRDVEQRLNFHNGGKIHVVRS